VRANATAEIPAEPDPTRRGGAGRVIRWIVAMLVCVLAALAATGAVAAFHAGAELLDSDRFTERTAVIAEDPEVKAKIAELISTEIEAAVDVDNIKAAASRWIWTEQPPEAISAFLNSAASSLRGYIDGEIQTFLDSDAYMKAWDSAVGDAHASLVSSLRGEDSGAFVAEGNSLTLELGPFIKAVKDQLVADGFDLAESMPAVEAQFVLLDSGQVPELEERAGQLEWAAKWGPWIALALLVIAILIAPRRRIAALVVGVLAAICAGAALLGLSMVRTEFIAQARDTDFAPKVFDAFAGDWYAAYALMLVLGITAAVASGLMLFLRRRRTA